MFTNVVFPSYGNMEPSFLMKGTIGTDDVMDDLLSPSEEYEPHSGMSEFPPLDEEGEPGDNDVNEMDDVD